MLILDGVSVEVAGKEILHDISLEVKPGETHVLFGPNGTGKTTLLMTIMGFSGYNVTKGRIFYKGEDITELPLHERARMGIGMSFQRPPTIRGLKTRQLVALCAKMKKDPEELARRLNFTEFLDRDVNSNLSGGEIKKSELLQLMAQNPDLVLLDEPESGVDLENIALVGEVIAELLDKTIKHFDEPMIEHKKKRKKSGIIITHTGFIMRYVKADVGHVILNGRLSCASNPEEIFACVGKFGYEECVRCMI